MSKLVWLVLVLGACSAWPDEIPKEPGTIKSAKDVRRLWLPTNPDNLANLHFMTRAFEIRSSDKCLRKEGYADGFTLIGEGCKDDNGVKWEGEATRSIGDIQHMEFAEFEMRDGDYQWRLNGSISWSHPNKSSDVDLAAVVEVEISDGTDAFLAYMDSQTRMEFTSRDNDGYSLRYVSGLVGVEDWGTADVSSTGVNLGLGNGCEYPRNGKMFALGTNEVVWSLGKPVQDGACAPCPTYQIDSGETVEMCDGHHILTAQILPNDEDD